MKHKITQLTGDDLQRPQSGYTVKVRTCRMVRAAKVASKHTKANGHRRLSGDKQKVGFQRSFNTVFFPFRTALKPIFRLENFCEFKIHGSKSALRAAISLFGRLS